LIYKNRLEIGGIVTRCDRQLTKMIIVNTQYT